MTRGVVIGKFYPPHRGHSLLIDTALAHCDQLTIIVCFRQDETIPGQLRADWIKELHPRATVMLVEDKNYPPDDSRFWAKQTIEWLGFTPDIAFTSESYGRPWTRFMGCRHLGVDPERQRFPVSGTMVRRDPYGCWQFLSEPVRAYFAKRIVVVGAESTGTTTLAQALAQHYQTAWVPEYGRYYYEAKMPLPQVHWTTDEFVHIATMQNQWEDAMARQANRLLIADTNSWATSVWHERYVGRISPEVAQVSHERQVDVYIVTDTDIPFVQDGTRDGEHLRQWMHERFINELAQQGQKYIVVSGSVAQRLRQATQAIEALFPNHSAPLLGVKSPQLAVV